MDFFGSLPQPEPPPRPVYQAPPVWARPSSRVLPAVIPGSNLLIHRPTVAVCMDYLRVYPDALVFTVRVQYRSGQTPRLHGEKGSVHPFRGSIFPYGDPAELRRVLRFGVLYADGRRALVQRRPPHPQHGGEPERPVMKSLSGYGTTGEWHQDFYIWGLPQQGPVTIVYSWLDQEVPESSFEIDGDAVRAAADRIVVLWEDDGEDDGAEEDGREDDDTAES